MGINKNMLLFKYKNDKLTEKEKRFAYLLYRQDWLDNRGYVQEDIDEETGHKVTGEIYACYEEFLSNEFVDEEYMEKLLDFDGYIECDENDDEDDCEDDEYIEITARVVEKVVKLTTIKLPKSMSRTRMIEEAKEKLLEMYESGDPDLEEQYEESSVIYDLEELNFTDHFN